MSGEREPAATGVEELRVDRWLWAARVFRSRSLALAACQEGSVRVGGQPVKPARLVRVGTVLEVAQGAWTRTLRVVGLSEKRVGPGRAAELVADETPPEEKAKARLTAAQQVLLRAPGAGRPTKRERRRLDAFFGAEEPDPDA